MNALDFVSDGVTRMTFSRIDSITKLNGCIQYNSGMW